MFEKILIATDGSEQGEKAAKVGVELARISGSRITAIYVADTSRMMHLPDDMLLFSIRELLRKEGEEAISYVEGLCREAGVSFEKAILEGHPAEEILNYARGAEMSIIVMGSVGRTGLDKFLLGSVAEKVVRNAKIPVLTVPGDVA